MKAALLEGIKQNIKVSYIRVGVQDHFNGIYGSLEMWQCDLHDDCFVTVGRDITFITDNVACANMRAALSCVPKEIGYKPLLMRAFSCRNARSFMPGICPLCLLSTWKTQQVHIFGRICAACIGDAARGKIDFPRKFLLITVASNKDCALQVMRLMATLTGDA
jgi:hypothetical protein